MERSDVRVGDREAAAVKGVEEARGDEPARGEHRVPTRPGRGPHEPGAGRRVDEREHRGQRAHGDAAVEARQRRVGHRLVRRAALLGSVSGETLQGGAHRKPFDVCFVLKATE